MRRAALIAFLLAGCAREQPLPIYGAVPPFELTDETGARFDSRSLDGQAWVADFIFTTCTGPCPRMSTLMRQVQSAAPAVKLLSFTVDPERDTPGVLAEYARRYKAEPGRWAFLTGPRETLHRLKRDVFKLGSVDGSLNHSTRLLLVDGKGRIRGYYGTDEDSPVQRLARDIKRIGAEKG